MTSYKVVRYFADESKPNETVLDGLTLDEAKEYLGNPETSSKTATGPVAKARTRKHGPWFEGFTEE
jgi:hypothetical protein